MNRNWTRLLAGLLVLAILSSALVSCGPGAPQAEPTKAVKPGLPDETIRVLKNWVGDKEVNEGQPQAGGTLNIVYVPMTVDLDVRLRKVSTLNEVAQYFYETLFDRDYTGKLKPLLVKEEQVSSDGLTITWKLQPGVKFCDGTAFNAEAVKWNLSRKLDTKEFMYERLTAITKMEAVDDLTLKLTLARPNFSLQAELAIKTFSMYSPAFFKKVGDDGLKTQACGTGPFLLTEFKVNEILRLKKNPDYWQKGLPLLDEVVFRSVPDINTRGTMLLAGDADVAMEISAADRERVKNTKGLKLLEQEGSHHYYLYVNNLKPPLDDVRVRRALNYAVDKEGIITSVFRGAATPAKAFSFTPTVDGYVEAGYYKYDADKAKALLDEAGVKDVDGDGLREGKDGKKLRMSYITRKGAVAGDFEIAELVQGMLKKVGLDVEITVMETASFLPAVTVAPDKATYYLVNAAVNFDSGDAASVMDQVISCDSWAPKFYNRCYYCNPQVDKLIAESKEARTLADRNAIYGKIVKQAWEDAPGLILVNPLMHIAMKDKVRGVYLSGAMNHWPAKYAWVVK